jgi:hypothetical protein
MAAMVLLPHLMQILRTEGWSALKRRVGIAACATSGTCAAIGGLAAWAPHLTYQQRNVGFGWYQLLFAIAATLFSITVFTWTVVVVTAARFLNIQEGQIKFVGALAIFVAAGMAIMTAATAVWWGSMAKTAPWFLAGVPAGTASSPLAINLLITMILMVVASGFGALGTIRIGQSWRLLQRTSETLKVS